MPILSVNRSLCSQYFGSQCFKEDELALKPSTLSPEEAASIPLTGLTAFQALTAKGNLQKI